MIVLKFHYRQMCKLFDYMKRVICYANISKFLHEKKSMDDGVRLVYMRFIYEIVSFKVGRMSIVVINRLNVSFPIKHNKRGISMSRSLFGW